MLLLVFKSSAASLQQASGALSGAAGAGDKLKGIATNDGQIAGLAQQILSDDKASEQSKQAAQQIAQKPVLMFLLFKD